MWLIFFLVLFFSILIGTAVSIVRHIGLYLGVSLGDAEINSDEFYNACTHEQFQAAVAELQAAEAELDDSHMFDWHIILYRWPLILLVTLRYIWRTAHPPKVQSYGI